MGVGRIATQEEIAGWDIDIGPDGHGLPVGKGTVKAGRAALPGALRRMSRRVRRKRGALADHHGRSRHPESHDPVKSIGSYWPYASTVMDYIRRTMPFGNAQSLTNDELYAVTAYVLYLNDVITDETFELNERNFTSIKLPNERNFADDDREIAETRVLEPGTPCMTDCLPGAARITGRARAIDVTPETGTAPKVE